MTCDLTCQLFKKNRQIFFGFLIFWISRWQIYPKVCMISCQTEDFLDIQQIMLIESLRTQMVSKRRSAWPSTVRMTRWFLNAHYWPNSVLLVKVGIEWCQWRQVPKSGSQCIGKWWNGNSCFWCLSYWDWLFPWQILRYLKMSPNHERKGAGCSQVLWIWKMCDRPCFRQWPFPISLVPLLVLMECDWLGGQLEVFSLYKSLKNLYSRRFIVSSGKSNFFPSLNFKYFS